MSSQRDRRYDIDRFGTPIAGLEPPHSLGVVVPACMDPAAPGEASPAPGDWASATGTLRPGRALRGAPALHRWRPAGVRPGEARHIRCLIPPLDAQDGSAVHVAAEMACASAELE